MKPAVFLSGTTNFDFLTKPLISVETSFLKVGCYHTAVLQTETPVPSFLVRNRMAPVTFEQLSSFSCLDILQQKYLINVFLYFLLKIPQITELIEELIDTTRCVKRNIKNPVGLTPIKAT